MTPKAFIKFVMDLRAAGARRVKIDDSDLGNFEIDFTGVAAEPLKRTPSGDPMPEGVGMDERAMQRELQLSATGLTGPDEPE